MSDTNWQCKEGDQFESRRMLSLQIANAVKPRMVGGFISAPGTQACYTAADHIEAQQQRIEALEHQLAEASKKAEMYEHVRTLSPREFARLWAASLRGKAKFDDLILADMDKRKKGQA